MYFTLTANAIYFIWQESCTFPNKNKHCPIPYKCIINQFDFIMIDGHIKILIWHCQGFQSGPVPGTFTRLRSCIVPAEITEPPKISGGQNHKYDRLVEYFS
jgi:hypothetical protein